MPPSWLHRGISREACEELITSAGLEDGRFLVRTRSDKPGEYVLCVVYKGKATHHLIAKNGDGFYCVNKKAYGEYTKVNRLIDALGKPGIQGWPVPLDKPVNVEGSDAASPSATDSGNSVEDTSAWKCTSLSREATEDALQSNGEFVDGGFLVRDRPKYPGEYILSVNYKGKPTHHLVSKNDEGTLIVNKKSFSGHKDIKDLVKELSTKQAGWPVALTVPSAPKSTSEKPAPPPEAAPKAEPVAAPEPELVTVVPTVVEPVTVVPTVPEPVPEPEPTPAPEVVAEVVVVPEPEPENDEPVEEPEPLPVVPPRTSLSQQHVVPQRSIEEETEQVNRSKAAAADAYIDVQNKMTELNALQSSSGTAPTLTLMNTPALSSTPTDGPELTFMLARAVLNLGQRVNSAEQKLDDLHTILQSLNVLGN